MNTIKRLVRNTILKSKLRKVNKKIPFVNCPLSREEKRLVKKTWGRVYSGDFKCYEFYKSFCGIFNPLYVSNASYKMMEIALNRTWVAPFMQHKCNLKYFVAKEHRPKTILQGIQYHLLDGNDNCLDAKTALQLLKSYAQFVYKPALLSGGGRNVVKVELKDVDDSYLMELISKSDFIIQDVILQSPFMAKFNESSVNTIRMLTLNINDNATLLSSFIRSGSSSSFVDNFSSSGGVIVGIDSSGRLSDYGIAKKKDGNGFEKVKTARSGLAFEGQIVPNFEQIKETVLAYCKNFPSANLIGWDIALDADDNPIVIEINLDSADIEPHQIFNGPVFGERTSEVIDYYHNHHTFICINL